MDKPLDRAEILQEALKIITGDRTQQYGEPEDSFSCIADLWSTFLTYSLAQPVTIMPHEAGIMLALMKIARLATSTGLGTPDTYIDLAGYAACAGESSAIEAYTLAKEDQENLMEESK